MFVKPVRPKIKNVCHSIDHKVLSNALFNSLVLSDIHNLCICDTSRGTVNAHSKKLGGGGGGVCAYVMQLTFVVFILDHKMLSFVLGGGGGSYPHTSTHTPPMCP